MFIVQLAAALGIFSILMGFGAEKAIQYAQSRLPYSTAQRVVQATNFVGNAANSYYNQYCSSGTCSTTGLKYPRIQDLVSSGYLPSGQGYSGCNCYTTKDGSVIRLNAGSGPSGTFGMTVTPGAMLASKQAYASMVASRIPGSVLSGNTISVSQPVPALSNIASSLSGKYIQNDPSTPQNGGINITQGITTQGPINTNGQPIYTGAINPSGNINFGNGVYEAPQLESVCYQYACVPGQKFVYAAPCNELGCGSWAWYPAGAEEIKNYSSYIGGIFSSGIRIENLPSHGCVYWLTQAGFAGNTCYDTAYLPG